MSKGLQRSLARGAMIEQEIVKLTLAVRDDLLTVDGASGVGFGTLVIGGLPQGNLQILGAVANLQFTGPTAAGLVDTWEGDFGIGSTPASDATITAADVDIIASTAIAAATAEASPVTRGTGAAAMIDNTDGAGELNLNLLIDDAHISADDIVMTVNGELYLAFIVLGDD